ncbi:alpha/beta fold hydrolase [Maribacter sp. 2307UL18-2]|uniref:alpha/beta fold hydrolase n=1 Tax=Maribacter sp. 2307UL18-2 TaxID=3386274 RepID=UPI0039BC6B78
MKEQYNPHYRIIGNGKKTIVFVHYFGGDAGSWQWLAKRLQKKHTCILLNLPGFNKTEPLDEPSIYGFAKYINTCIEELQLMDYILCGHSMGAKLVLYAAKLMAGVKPSRIILIAPSPPTIEEMPEGEKKRMLRHPNEKEAKNTVQGATSKKLQRKKYDYAVASQLRIDEKTWDWWINDGMKNNIAERIKDLEMPSHVIFSKNDPVIKTESIYEEVLPYLQNPSVIALGKIGHLLPMEAPRKIARQIKRISKMQPEEENYDH